MWKLQPFTIRATSPVQLVQGQRYHTAIAVCNLYFLAFFFFYIMFTKVVVCNGNSPVAQLSSFLRGKPACAVLRYPVLSWLVLHFICFCFLLKLRVFFAKMTSVVCQNDVFSLPKRRTLPKLCVCGVCVCVVVCVASHLKRLWSDPLQLAFGKQFSILRLSHSVRPWFSFFLLTTVLV